MPSGDLVSLGGGGIHTIHMTDPARIALLSEVKVGDVVTALISDVVAVEKADRSWR